VINVAAGTIGIWGDHQLIVVDVCKALAVGEELFVETMEAPYSIPGLRGVSLSEPIDLRDLSTLLARDLDVLHFRFEMVEANRVCISRLE